MTPPSRTGSRTGLSVRVPARPSARYADNSKKTPGCRFPPIGASMIAKTFILAKEIRAMRAKSLRDNQSLRDHEPAMRDNSKKPCVPSRMADNSKKRRSATAAPTGFAMIVDRWVHPDVPNDPRSRCDARQPQITA